MGFATRPVTYRHSTPFAAIDSILLPATAVRFTGPTTGPNVDAAVPWIDGGDVTLGHYVRKSEAQLRAARGVGLRDGSAQALLASSYWP